MKGLIVFISILFLLLVVRFWFFFQNGVTYSDGQHLRVQASMLSEPQHQGRFQKFTIRLSHGERVFITTSQYPNYHYGDNLVIDGKLSEKQVRGGSIYTMSFPKITNCHFGEDSGCASLTRMTFLVSLLAPLRERIVWVFHTSLSQPESSLLLGIVFGIQETMPKSFQTVLQQAGVLHVIAASGMNVTMIAAFLSVIFGKILRRQYSLLASIGVIILYTVFAGLSASIVRAAIMGCLVFVGQLLGRQTLALYGIFLAGFIMLFWSPFLLFDTGFQLSFMATWGLIVFSPILQNHFKKESKISNIIAETDFSTTFIAQIVTLPILLGTFGTYSPASILANMLILWMIPILMIIGAAGAVVGLMMPILGSWVLYLSLPFLILFEKIVWFFGNLPWQLSVDGLSWPFVIGHYCLLGALYFSIKRNLSFRAKGEKSP